MNNQERKESVIDTAQLHEVTLTLEKALEYIRGLQTKVIHEGISRADRINATQYEIVSEILETADSPGLSVSQIAEASGIPQASVRMVLYSNKDRFDAERLSPRRIRWSLNENNNVSSCAEHEVGELV